MRSFAAIFLLFLATFGCQKTSELSYHSVERPEFLPALVGKRVEIWGVVSNTPVPQISGVDLWGFERYQGQRLRVRGILQCSVSVRTGGDTAKRIDSGDDKFIPPVYRGSGTFYRLQSLTYDIVP